MDNEGWVQKWITGRCQDAWVRIEFNGKKLSIAGVGIKSADDCPGRDPTSMKVSYLNEEGAYVDAGKYARDF